MKNFVLTFLVGALVVFGGFGVANALTFKSDGSVVQKDGKVVKKADKQKPLTAKALCKKATLDKTH